MTHPSFSRVWIRFFCFLLIVDAGIAEQRPPRKNNDAKIEILREKAIAILLQSFVRVTLHSGQSFWGRLNEVAEKSVKLLLRGDQKVEVRELPYEDMRSFGKDHEFQNPKRALQNRLFEVPEGSLVELRLRSKQKATGVIEEFLDEALVFRIRAGNTFEEKKILLSEVKSFSVKSLARSTVASDPKVFDTLREIREMSLSTLSLEERAKQGGSTAAIPVVIRLLHTVSTVDARVDDQVDFEIMTDAKIGDQVVLSKGGSAWGKVTDVVAKKRAGRGAEVHFSLQFARTPAGEEMPLRAFQRAERGGQAVGTIAAMAVVGGLFSPILGPLVLFQHGSDTAIPKGTLAIAYLPLESIK